MLNIVADLTGLETSECVMTGDRLYTDIRMALDAGMPSAVVLTGETTAEALTDEPASNRPTYILERIDQLIPQQLWEEFGWTEGQE